MTVPNVAPNTPITSAWGNALTDAVNANTARLTDYTLLPGAKAQTMPRNLAYAQAAPVTGRIALTAIGLVAGTVINSISHCSGVTPATLSQCQFMIFDVNNVLRATTVVDTTNWAANTIRTLAIANVAAGAASSYTVPTSGLYYLGLVVIGTPQNVVCHPGGGTYGVIGAVPRVAATADTITLPRAFPFTATQSATGTSALWAQVS